jgi:hypothetical protein
VFFEFWVVFSRGEVEEGGQYVYFKELLRVIVIWVLWVGRQRGSTLRYT